MNRDSGQITGTPAAASDGPVVMAVEAVDAVEAVETVAEATAGRLLPCLFRVVVGLSAFDATAVTEGGDKVWEIGLYYG